jgi:DNA-binding transcriptional LysR family regulator
VPALSQVIGRLRFRHLALLVAIGEYRNLHRAARAVHLAQPSATKLVRDLEQLFGAPLFERLPRGMDPTELGCEVLAVAKRMLTELERLVEDLDNKQKGGYGQLTVGAIMGAAPDVVVRALADVKKQRPLLVIQLMGETSDEIIGLLLKGKIDVAVDRFSNPLQHNDIHYELLGNEVLYVVSRIDHPLTRVRNLQLAMLAQTPWILQPLTSPARQILEQEFGREGMKTPPNIVECTSVFATLQLLQKTDAVTLLPESVVRDHMLAGLLVRLPLKVGKSPSGFGILSRRGEALSATVLELVQALRRYAALMGQEQAQRTVRGKPVNRVRKKLRRRQHGHDSGHESGGISNPLLRPF